MTDKPEIYDVEVSYWDKQAQKFEDYRVTCKRGGLIINASPGRTQYKGLNIRDIIADYQRNNIGYRWTKKDIKEVPPCPSTPT